MRFVQAAALVVGLVVFWFVLTRFRSGEINAVDFTVYYDRPCFQTVLGRPLFVETGDDPLRAQRSYLAVHAHWVMLPLAGLYLLWASPLWLLGLSVFAVVAGAIYTLRILQRVGAGGLVATASAFAFIFNDNTARTLNYGFHTEVLYAWFIPWMLHAGLLGRRRSFLIAVAACVAVKEDAVFPIFAVAVALALLRGRTMTGRDRILFLVAPLTVALLNVALYYRYVVPALSPTGAPFYSNYWSHYGPTLTLALAGMLTHPGEVLTRTATSAFFTRVIVPHLYLPLLGWRWTLGTVPMVLLHGNASNEQMRSFGIYYAIVLVPFLVIGAAQGALSAARWFSKDDTRARLGAAAVITLGALVAGISDAGYSLRPWRTEIAAVPAALEALAEEPVVLVQSGLYPHAGYQERVQLLTRDTLADPVNRGGAILLAPRVSGYPLSTHELTVLAELPAIRQLPGGLIAVRRGVK